MHLPIVSDEAFRLNASQALCMLMDALRYLSNPDDKVARASLIINYKLQITNENKEELSKIKKQIENLLNYNFKFRY